jgi:hypothetical protein
MTEMVLPQLVEAEAQLAAEEAALTQQLAELQEKIKGIQTVIAMFGGSAQNNGKSAAATVVAPPVVEVAEEEIEEAAEEAPVVAASTKADKTPRSTRGRRTKAAPAASKKVAAKATKSAPVKAGKRGGKASNWQRYVREDFSKTPLPDIVENILKAQPKNSFKIAEVMAEIFPEDMPKAQFLKARNRISNILSAGARSGEWYRGRGGTYSCSEKALKVS